MVDEAIKEKLKSNWGERCNALACYAELRIFDPISPWEAYILAINPQDEDECMALIIDESGTLFHVSCSLSMLFERYNREGEFMEIDHAFKRRKAEALFKILKERYPS